MHNNQKQKKKRKLKYAQIKLNNLQKKISLLCVINQTIIEQNEKKKNF